MIASGTEEEQIFIAKQKDDMGYKSPYTQKTHNNK